jgi:hypothetical protein
MNITKATLHPAPPVKKPEDTVTLTMPRSRAEALRAILLHVGGDPRTTRRGLTDEISDALASLGISGADPDIARTRCGTNQSIYFS